MLSKEGFEAASFLIPSWSQPVSCLPSRCKSNFLPFWWLGNLLCSALINHERPELSLLLPLCVVQSGWEPRLHKCQTPWFPDCGGSCSPFPVFPLFTIMFLVYMSQESPPGLSSGVQSSSLPQTMEYE